jgi:hypothetical protein
MWIKYPVSKFMKVHSVGTTYEEMDEQMERWGLIC